MNGIRFSPRRRHLMLAALAGTAAPGVLAAPAGKTAASDGELQRLVVSGRCAGPDGKALAGATVEAWSPGSSASAIAATDGDGRFVLTIQTAAGPAGRPADLRYRIRHEGRASHEARLRFARAPGVPVDRIAQARRDETGTWRAAFAATFV